MKASLAALSLLFCFSMSLIFPRLAQSTVYVDPSYCLDCHEHSADGIHSDHSEEDCNRCHEGTPEEGNVQSQNCVDCHIDHGNGKCSLVGNHGSGADCTTCHFECTSPPDRHIDFCVECHLSDDLHDYLGHSDCIQCHGHGGPVEPTSCMVCHPLGAPGKCNLSNYHDPRMGTECFTCHTECTGVVTTTTTTIQTYPHYTNTCEQCHLPADLHAGLGHTNCAECHNGAPQAGNVEPANCIVCHPLLGPGSCNLIEGHDPNFGADCLSCHVECSGGPSTTTTIQTFPHYTNTCEQCHLPADLHAGLGHGNCAECHNGAPQVGNVEPANCIVCHPQAGPGSCNLIEEHDPNFGATCLSCHVECGGGPTTTTTILLWNHFQYNCLDCHIVDTLHGGVGHTNCAVCHNGPPQLDNVTASNCIVCHPLTSPGECSLADLSFHQGATCKGCHEHFDCRVTTTTVPATTTTAPTTTTTAPTTTTTAPTTTTTAPTTTTTAPTTTTTAPTTTTTAPTTTTTGADSDNDGIPDDTDNCPGTPNAGQGDTYPPGGNGIGDACECEGDFNCSGGVDADDVVPFMNDFGRSPFNNPCANDNQCAGDFDCNRGVDAADVNTFLEDFGRSQFFNPCPSCETGNWCSY